MKTRKYKENEDKDQPPIAQNRLKAPTEAADSGSESLYPTIQRYEPRKTRQILCPGKIINQSISLYMI